MWCSLCPLHVTLLREAHNDLKIHFYTNATFNWSSSMPHVPHISGREKSRLRTCPVFLQPAQTVFHTAHCKEIFIYFNNTQINKNIKPELRLYVFFLQLNKTNVAIVLKHLSALLWQYAQHLIFVFSQQEIGLFIDIRQYWYCIRYCCILHYWLLLLPFVFYLHSTSVHTVGWHQG